MSDINKSSREHRIAAWVLVIGTIAVMFVLAWYTPSSPKNGSHKTATGAVEHKQMRTTLRASPPPPSVPTHYYSYEKDGEYGYETQLSQTQIDRGIASAPLIMVRYMGELRGVYRAQIVTGSPEIVSGPITVVISCSSPCNYITTHEYYFNSYGGAALIDKEVMPAGTTVSAAILHDAMSGQLKVYKWARHPQ